MNDTPLFAAIAEHLAKGRCSLHTPGHKGRAPLLGGLELAFDVTELPDTDSLYEASGAIAEAERLAAGVFGAAGTVFSAGGCSLAIQAMLRCCCREGDRMLAGRACHRSAVNACALLGLEPVWLLHGAAGGDGLAPQPTAADVERTLDAYRDIRAVYLTSPDYLGRLCDISGTADICRRRGIPLLVDNAHGAHLIAFGLHPLTLGASMTACSAHKTLPVLTGGAYLSAADPALAARMKPAMALFGSTSPSYLTMASLDLCRAWLAGEGGGALRETAAVCAALRDKAVAAGFGLPSGVCDPMRLTLLTAPIGASGTCVAERLRERGFEPEYADGSCVVLLPSPFNTAEELRRLGEALGRITASRMEDNAPALPPIAEVMACAVASKQVMPLREAALGGRERLPVAECVGRVSAGCVCPCPPGIPVVMPGELISAEAAELLARMGCGEAECVAGR